MNNRRWLAAGGMGCFIILLGSILAVPMFFGATQFLFGNSNGGLSSNCTDTANAAVQPQQAAAADSIPSNYLALYKQAGEKYGIPWNVLAGIGEQETNHGRSKEPGTLSGQNSAGAGGPMQFLQSTFDTFAVDGDHDGKKNRYDPADAIFTAAAYLKHNGAPTRMRTAIFMYNHAWWYVDNVLNSAKKYATGNFAVVQANGPICSDNNLIGNVGNALIAKAIAFAMAQRGKPYVFGGNGPDSWDCSSLVQAAYRAAGINIPRTTFDQWPMGLQIPKGQEQPGDLVFFMTGPNAGPGHPGHVGMVIGNGKMIVARCTLCVPAIGVFPYRNRSDWYGVTRPLASKTVQKQLASAK